MQGYYSKCIDITYLVDVKCSVDALPSFGLMTNDVCDLQTGNIEGFRGRVEHHTVVPACIAYGCKGLVGVAGHGELTVDFIGNNLHAMLQANVVHAFKFFFCPHASRGIMRIAEQEYGGFLIGTLALEVFEINHVAVTLSAKWIFQDLTTVVFDRREETVVDGSLYQCLVARHRHGFQ